MGLAKYLRLAWKQPKKNLEDLHRQRLILFRKQPATVKVEHPTRLDKARSLGYKAKQGVIIVRQRVPRGGYRKEVGLGGRKPRNSGGQKIVGKNMQWIAEERSVKKYPNMEVLNSYFVGADGMYKWYEVILVDRNHPGVKKDAHLKFLAQKHNKRRVNRGLTSAAKKSRGLRRKGKGAEKVRPSLRANKSRLK